MANGAKVVYFMTAKEAADHLRIAVNTFYIWARKKNGPPTLRLRDGPRRKPRIRVPREQFLDWVEAQNKGV